MMQKAFFFRADGLAELREDWKRVTGDLDVDAEAEGDDWFVLSSDDQVALLEIATTLGEHSDDLRGGISLRPQSESRPR
jgi:hypothetical protein